MIVPSTARVAPESIVPSVPMVNGAQVLLLFQYLIAMVAVSELASLMTNENDFAGTGVLIKTQSNASNVPIASKTAFVVVFPSDTSME